jgi:uncharacterized phiE125 gp8 family phage protein
MSTSVVTTVAATFQAVSRTELADHLKLSEPEAEADVLDAILVAAEKYLENNMGRAIASRTMVYQREAFPVGNRDILLPYPPLTSVTSVEYTDTEGNNQVLSSSLYQVDTRHYIGRIRPEYGETWPSTRWGDFDAVRVTFVTGYASAAAVPTPIKQAIKLIAGDLWYNREDSTTAQGLTQSVSVSAKALTAAFVVPSFGCL